MQTKNSKGIGVTLIPVKEKRERLEMHSGEKPKRDLLEFFETEIWPLLPKEELDQPPMSKREAEDLLGYGEDGL